MELLTRHIVKRGIEFILLDFDWCSLTARRSPWRRFRIILVLVIVIDNPTSRSASPPLTCTRTSSRPVWSTRCT